MRKSNITLVINILMLVPTDTYFIFKCINKVLIINRQRDIFSSFSLSLSPFQFRRKKIDDCIHHFRHVGVMTLSVRLQFSLFLSFVFFSRSPYIFVNSEFVPSCMKIGYSRKKKTTFFDEYFSFRPLDMS